jgi:transcriptional regulator
MLEGQLKKGTTPFLILALLEHQPRHGYELSRLIETRSDGVVRMHAASLYPLLYQLEQQKWIAGRWVEKPGERRRRFYRLTAAGRRQLELQRESWVAFAQAIGRIAGVQYA